MHSNLVSHLMINKATDPDPARNPPRRSPVLFTLKRWVRFQVFQPSSDKEEDYCNGIWPVGFFDCSNQGHADGRLLSSVCATRQMDTRPNLCSGGYLSDASLWGTFTEGRVALTACRATNIAVQTQGEARTTGKKRGTGELYFPVPILISVRAPNPIFIRLTLPCPSVGARQGL